MNVFVTGTGRCGSLTFAHACSHALNYTVAHESRAGCPGDSHLWYPDDHIEVDPHLSWMLGPLVEKYPSAVYVHLLRDRDLVVASWRRRSIHPRWGAAAFVDAVYQARSDNMSDTEYEQALVGLYNTVNANIHVALKEVSSMTIHIVDIARHFPQFWAAVGARGDVHAALREFATRYNSS